MISTDLDKIDEVLFRSVDSIYPSKELLREKLLEGRRLSIYVGIDPTADYVHLGHSTNYLILERLHALGHRIIVLVGDFTAMIGDPSDKTSMRQQLTREEVENNLVSYKNQIGKILDFNSKENPIECKFNSEWLSKLNFIDAVELASQFTVQQMIERDAFQKRLKDEKPLYVHEFLYPLMQGYDSVAMEVDIEIGGTDQTFNMLAGRTLSKKILNKEKFVITTTLLVNPITGEKMMSKSLGTGISLKENPRDMFGKIMRLPDEGMIQVFIDCTRMTMSEINKYEQDLRSGINPRDVKLALAHAIVTMYHGEEVATAEKEFFIETFSNKHIDQSSIAVLAPSAFDIVTVLREAQFAESNTEVRRLIDEGSVKINGEVTKDLKHVCSSGDLVQKGKRFFITLS